MITLGPIETDHIIRKSTPYLSSFKSEDGFLPNWSHKPIGNIISDHIKQVPHKPGGLDSRDQLRLRSRFLNLSRSTFETCRDYPYCQDKIIFSRSKFLKLRLFNRDSGCVEIFEIC